MYLKTLMWRAPRAKRRSEFALDPDLRIVRTWSIRVSTPETVRFFPVEKIALTIGY